MNAAGDVKSFYQEMLQLALTKFGVKEFQLLNFREILRLISSDSSVIAGVDATTPTRLIDVRISSARLLRRVCGLSGIRLFSKNYHFDQFAPFEATDVFGVVPVVRRKI